MISDEDKKFLISLGSQIRSLRLSRGLSQEELGGLSGIHRTYISSLERGQRNIAVINLRKIASILDMPISELFRFQ